MIPSEIKNVTAMRLVSIEIPNSWYLFSKLKKNKGSELFLIGTDMEIGETLA